MDNKVNNAKKRVVLGSIHDLENGAQIDACHHLLCRSRRTSKLTLQDIPLTIPPYDVQGRHSDVINSNSLIFDYLGP